MQKRSFLYENFLALDRPGVSRSRLALCFKRIEDLRFATALLLLLSPIVLVCALTVKLDSPGPILFWQQRRGFNGRLIWVCKFRTMYCHRIDQDGVIQTTPGDERVTPVGRFLRKHSLDELPQLLNVIDGTMSLVGPRPHALGTNINGLNIETLHPAYMARFTMKPGLTGWA